MKWSKLKEMIESGFANSVKSRIKIFSTRYTIASYSMARAWITLDNHEIINFSTIESEQIHKAVYNEVTGSKCASHPSSPIDERDPELILEKGEFSRQDFHEACFKFLNINFNDALRHANPIVQMLAFFDRRFGKRRLNEFSEESLHPLSLWALRTRKTLEKNPI